MSSNDGVVFHSIEHSTDGIRVLCSLCCASRHRASVFQPSDVAHASSTLFTFSFFFNSPASAIRVSFRFDVTCFLCFKSLRFVLFLTSQHDRSKQPIDPTSRRRAISRSRCRSSKVKNSIGSNLQFLMIRVSRLRRNRRAESCAENAGTKKIGLSFDTIVFYRCGVDGYRE